MSKYNLYNQIQTEAVANALLKSDISFFRKVCRWYSKTFSTPLHLVMEGNVVAWDEVLTHYYEDQIEDVSYDKIYEIACREYVDEIAEEVEKEDEEYAKALIKEQKKTLKKKKEKEAKKQKKLPPKMNLTFDDEEV